MRRGSLLGAALVLAAGAAQAEIPFFNATCGDGIEVHADEGGPVYIDGTEAEVAVSNDEYFEASVGDTTISVSIGDDGSVTASYTGAGGANGICQITE